MILQLHFTKSLKRDNVVYAPRRTNLPSNNTLACSKAEI